jgi:uncharacterized membrane protein
MAKLLAILKKSEWFSGKIRACHARAPCSIHGSDNCFAFCIMFHVVRVMLIVQIVLE